MALCLTVLYEDASAHTQEAVRSLIKAGLKLLGITEAFNSFHDFREIEDEEIRQLLAGNEWRGPRNRVRVARFLARELDTLSIDPGWLWLWHVDGDVPWSERGWSEGVADQHELCRTVSETLKHPKADGTPRNDAAAEALAARLVPLNPHYSIEAWTYQHFAKARTLLPARSQAELAHAELDAWHDNRADVDEVEQISSESAVGRQLAKKYNKDLTAAGWPAQEVHAANASFAAFVGLLQLALKRQGLLP